MKATTKKRIHDVPVSEYKKAYNLLQAFLADFDFNEEQPIEKAKLIHLIHLLAKRLDEEKCSQMLAEEGITEEDIHAFFIELMYESLRMY